MKLSLSLFAAVLLAGVQASNVIDLTPENFDSVVGKGKPGLVEFFAPWCGHCKNLAPIYEQLADAYSHASDKVLVAKVDADGAGRSLGERYSVTGFPTLKWFSADGKDEPYEGGRDLDALAEFITKKTGVKSNIKPPPPPETVILNSHTFDDVVSDKSKNVLVSFTAPWCGHCKNMKPTYELVATTFKPESDCIVANLDADAQPNKPLASKYGVSSFPTIKFFSKENKENPEDYDGDRSEAAFVEYLNEKCGTQRAVGGGLNEEAGRHSELDTLASKFFVATGDLRDSIYKEASVLADQAGDAYKHYIRVMEKVVDGSEEYLEKETKRLSTILKKRNLSQSKLDEIKVKFNILSAFVEQKIDEAAEKVSEAFKKAEAEL